MFIKKIKIEIIFKFKFWNQKMTPLIDECEPYLRVSEMIRSMIQRIMEEEEKLRKWFQVVDNFSSSL